MAGARSRQAQLQELVGGRGKVLPFVSIPHLKRRAAGWYLEPSSASEGCDCDVCQAAREQRPAFVATGSLLAAALLSEYAREHPAPTQEATG